MSNQRSRRFFMAIIAFSLLIPIALLFWNVEIGGFMLLVGLAVAWRSMRLLRADEDSAETKAQRQARDDRGQTVFVQLVDDAGNDLEPAQAQARLAAAQLTAGPRDTVVGVRRKVS